jgi:hypothetical protein
MAAIQTLLGSATKLGLLTGSTSNGVTFDGIENLSIKAANNRYQDLLIVRGTGSYDGNAGTDTLFADWSTASTDITWINDPFSAAQAVNGSTITAMERMLLRTGSGNDTISNTNVATNDQIVTGAGNDTINAGAGGDRVDAGSGDDRIVGGSGNDTLLGGTGTDTAVYASSRASYTVTIGTGSVHVNSGIGTEGSDNLTNVERLQFSDTTLGLDTAMGQVSGNSLLLCGAVLGNDLLVSKKALVGAVESPPTCSRPSTRWRRMRQLWRLPWRRWTAKQGQRRVPSCGIWPSPPTIKLRSTWSGWRLLASNTALEPPLQYPQHCVFGYGCSGGSEWEWNLLAGARQISIRSLGYAFNRQGYRIVFRTSIGTGVNCSHACQCSRSWAPKAQFFAI